MSMTMAEKIMARASGRQSVSPGEYVTCQVDMAMVHDFGTGIFESLRRMGLNELFDPKKVAVIIDHYFPAPTVQAADGHRRLREVCEFYGVNFLGPAGICHQVLPEQGFVRPGALVLGCDSHSSTYGAFGAAGAGIGSTEMAYVLALGSLWMQVPPTIRFNLNGEARNGVLSKDIMLYIAGRYTTEVAQYQSVEFHGEAARRMSMSGRWTMSNMGIEIGAKFAMFPSDATTIEYLTPRMSPAPEPFGPDEDAQYSVVHDIDVGALEPQVACPHDVQNVKPVSEVAGTRVDQVFLGSCTNGRVEDIAVAADVLRGRKISPRVRMIVTPSSHQVMVEATRAGYIQTLVEAGASVTPAGCGACPGGHMGVLGPGEVSMSSTNRNFKGRMGSPDGFVYLGSPATVAATAIAGEIADPRQFVHGTTRL